MLSCVGISALGCPASAKTQVRRWLDALTSTPGRTLVLETGEDRAGSFLRAYGPGDLLAMSDGAACSMLKGVILPDLPPPLCPMQGEAFAVGRIVWRGTQLDSPLEESKGFQHEPARWAVQGLFGADERGHLNAHVRVISCGPITVAAPVRDRIGLRWATALGALYEPWSTASRVNEIAMREWAARKVVRFHSGEENPPTIEALSSPWTAPPAWRPVTAPRTWRLGWSWNGGCEMRASDRDMLRHVGIIGMTGSGKTQYLAHLASEAARNGAQFAVFDLHGDLGPAVTARLDTTALDGVVVVDGSRQWGEGRAGVDVLAPGDSAVGEDLVVAEVLSALRPLAGSSEEFWGPRLERILDSAVRAVLGANGNLADVAALLYDPSRNAETLAKGTEQRYLRGFLENLPGLNKRQPDYLASSQNRLTHVALSNVVRALVAPSGRSVVLEEAISRGRSLVFHLPKGVMGDGPSLFVANLLLSRLFLSLVRNRDMGCERLRSLIVLDEAQNFSPALLRTFLETGRKFGVGTVFATQSSDRLEGSLGTSITSTVGTLFLLRNPPASAARALSLVTEKSLSVREREEVEKCLSTLPDHTGIARFHGEEGTTICSLPNPAWPNDSLWAEVSERSVREYGNPEVDDGTAKDEASTEEILLRAVMAEARGEVIDLSERDEIEPGPSSAELGRAVEKSLRCNWIEPRAGGHIAVTPAGWARLGLKEDSGAPRESSEHRRLVLTAFRLFAERGIRLEIPQQGRFDMRVPDAIGRQLHGDRWKSLPPLEIRRLLASREGEWLWRFGRGRDIYVEAEVSHVDEPKRLKRSLEKAKRAGAYLLFLSGTSWGGEKLRAFLAREGWNGDRAAVWVLRQDPK